MGGSVVIIVAASFQLPGGLKLLAEDRSLTTTRMDLPHRHSYRYRASGTANLHCILRLYSLMLIVCQENPRDYFANDSITVIPSGEGI